MRGDVALPLLLGSGLVLLLRLGPSLELASLGVLAATLGPLARAGDWHPLPEPGPGTLWTDDYANVLRVIRWR